MSAHDDVLLNAAQAIIDAGDEGQDRGRASRVLLLFESIDEHGDTALTYSYTEDMGQWDTIGFVEWYKLACLHEYQRDDD